MQEEDDDIEHDYNIFHIPKFNKLARNETLFK